MDECTAGNRDQMIQTPLHVVQTHRVERWRDVDFEMSDFLELTLEQGAVTRPVLVELSA